jgi:nitrous oxidase accessory protein NosD
MHAKRRILACAVAVTAGAWVVGATAAPAVADESHHAVFVAKKASMRHDGDSCADARYNTIAGGVAAATAGSTVVVCPGTYTEDVIVGKQLTLSGEHATIDATGLENGIQVVASGVTVRGFTVRNANGEGVLVGIDAFADAGLLPPSVVVSHVLIDDVSAISNDKGFNGTESGNCKYPGDCGGGIHLNVTSWSTVRNSRAVGGADGILLTDDYGPNSHNTIAHNVVTDNTTECGIVLAGHSQGAVSYDPNTFAVTGRNPTVGGVFDNVIVGNVSLRNGTAKAPPQFGGGGSGSGIGIFGSAPGAGAYDNVVQDNYAAGNGLAGFTIHAHLPGGEDVNGNQVVNNVFGQNNTGGDGYDGPPGPTDFATTGIAVYSIPSVTMTITHNVVFNNAIGIWLSNTVNAQGLNHNVFIKVQQGVVRG